MAGDITVEQIDGVHTVVDAKASRKVSKVEKSDETLLIRGLPVAAALAVVAIFAQTQLRDSHSANFLENEILLPPAVEAPVLTVEQIAPTAVLSEDLFKASLSPTYENSDVQLAAKEDVAGLLTPEVIARVNDLSPLVFQIANEYGVPADALLGQIAIESGGDSQAVSYAGARGVLQIMPWLAQKYEMDPTDSEASIRLGSMILSDEYNRFGDWGLAFWSWHIGDGEIYWALQTYARLEYGVTLPDIDIIPADESEQSQAYANDLVTYVAGQYKSFVVQCNVTPFKLLQNQTINEAYSDLNSDNTLEYVPRINEAMGVLSGK